MPVLKVGTIIPTTKDNERIKKGIANDPDTRELSDAEFKQLRPVGRPKAMQTKDCIIVPFSPKRIIRMG